MGPRVVDQVFPILYGADIMRADHLITPRTAFHTLRLVASFALLGAVLAGVAFGWSGEDFRAYGAAVGGLLAVAGKSIHVI